MANSSRKKLFCIVAAYYGVLLMGFIYMGYTKPAVGKYLPFGGIEYLRAGSETLENLSVNEMKDLMETKTTIWNRHDDAINLFTALTGALLVMLPMRWIYLHRSTETRADPEFATSVMILPLVVTAIVYIVKYSLPLAFALAGIVAGVRYRMSLKRPSDAYFTFASIGIGLSAGTRALGIGLVLAIFVSLTLLSMPKPEDGLGVKRFD